MWTAYSIQAAGDTGSGGNGNDRATGAPEQNVANSAADFYEKLFSCVDAIKTGDYSAFEKKTMAP